MLGNIYKKYNARVKVQKQISTNRFTCKQWLNGEVIILSMTRQQLKQLEYICTL